jgi:hypothetical protein
MIMVYVSMEGGGGGGEEVWCGGGGEYVMLKNEYWMGWGVSVAESPENASNIIIVIVLIIIVVVFLSAIVMETVYKT